MSDSRKPHPEWTDLPQLQIVEVEVPAERPVPVDPELVSQVWTSQKSANLPN